MSPQEILHKYWGFSSFREKQLDIIECVNEGKDTLALLPTGGGKSICFQVPTLMKEGLCIVVTPLIALMKDQVENLKKRGIKATAIYSGMHNREMMNAIYNSKYGDNKFLYLSPERLKTDLIKENINNLPVSLLAIDEAHCISQWGYDFRPSYLEISEIRKYLPNVPVLALTATATKNVVVDIQEKLLFKKNNVIRKSFKRKSLSYVVYKEEKKNKRLLSIVKNVAGSGIVYVRSRSRAVEIARFLEKNEFKATFYHAGMNTRQRDKAQENWMKGWSKVMVSTTAFGMGIDKADVRFVVHYDIPESLEAYYQEAGRAGRDGRRSYAVLLYDESDKLNTIKLIETKFPKPESIQRVYKALGNYLDIPIEGGENQNYSFSFKDFCNQYKFQIQNAYNSLKILEKEAYIRYEESPDSVSKIHFIASREDIYRFQVESEKYDYFIKFLLRLYSGLFSGFTKIYEKEIANKSKFNEKEVEKELRFLDRTGILLYQKKLKGSIITLLTKRVRAENLQFTKENYSDRKKESQKRLDAVINYISEFDRCREQMLLSYFDEISKERCGHCEYCIKRKKIKLKDDEFDAIISSIRPSLQKQSLTPEEIVKCSAIQAEDKVLTTLQWLLDHNYITQTDVAKYQWNDAL